MESLDNFISENRGAIIEIPDSGEKVGEVRMPVSEKMEKGCRAGYVARVYFPKLTQNGSNQLNQKVLEA